MNPVYQRGMRARTGPGLLKMKSDPEFQFCRRLSCEFMDSEFRAALCHIKACQSIPYFGGQFIEQIHRFAAWIKPIILDLDQP